jgi:hypothetical protein
MVGLTAPVTAVRRARPAGAAAPVGGGRWFGPRVPLPLLSIDALRRTS